MESIRRNCLAVALAGLLTFLSGVPSWAQSLSDVPARAPSGQLSALLGREVTPDLNVRLASATDFSPDDCFECSGSGCGQCCLTPSAGCSQPGFLAGAEYLSIRPHFSEAIAFARGSMAAALQVEGQELGFDYNSSLRAFVGYRLGCADAELRFTFWSLWGDVSVDGTANLGANEFLVDPFGNIVGAVMVIDPGDRRFQDPQEGVLIGGDLIQTMASVNVNAYDLDFIKPIRLENSNWDLNWSVGVRIADVDQYYESIITDGGNAFSNGDFTVDFVGAGPRLGFGARRHFGRSRQFSLFVDGHGSLLLGNYDVRFNNTVTTPFPFTASQRENLTRTIPVIETEVGASWQVGNSLNLSLGWMFQAWLDMGTSGGDFGGYFGGADDGNIMSFDGLFASAGWTF